MYIGNNSLAGYAQGASILQSTLANRPTPGFINTLFLATDTSSLYRDNGSSWEPISVPLTVGTGTLSITQTLLLAADPTTPQGAATKHYIDTQIATLSGSIITGSVGLAGTGLVLTGSTFSLAPGVVAPGSYNLVTVDTYGRVTAGSVTGGGGTSGAVADAGNTPSIAADITANRPVAGAVGRLFIDTTLNIIERDNGSSWVNIGGTSGGGGTTYTAGNGIQVAGTVISAVTASASRILVGSGGIDLALSGVTAGTYNSVTVDTHGRVTAGSTVSATIVTVIDENASSATFYPTFVSAFTGTPALETSSANLTYVPNTGTMTCTNFNSTSDISLKSDVVTSKGLEVVEQLRGVDFTWIASGLKSHGVIAQEVEVVLPELVTEINGVKSVHYDALISFLIESVKELSAKVKVLEAK